jgi:hypothetical protein
MKMSFFWGVLSGIISRIDFDPSRFNGYIIFIISSQILFSVAIIGLKNILPFSVFRVSNFQNRTSENGVLFPSANVGNLAVFLKRGLVLSTFN